MSLNRNNFLRWAGSMYESAFENIAKPVLATMITNYPFIDIPILADAVSTFGINMNSVRTTTMSGTPVRPAQWNAATQLLRVFRPESMPLTQKVLVDYQFDDHMGNESNKARVTVDLSLSTLDWRAYTPSVYCVKNAFGVNTGYKTYSSLELFYPGSSATYVPLTLKPNAIGDPDYIAPFTDLTACPLPSVAPLTIQNNTVPVSPTVNLNTVTFKKAPNPDIVFNVFLAGGASAVISFPTGIYDSMEIAFVPGAPITGGGFTWSFSPGQTNTISGPLTDTNSPIVILTPTHAQPGSTISIQH